MVSKNVRAEVIEAQEFPALAQKYQVRGVPMTILNENLSTALVGAVPPVQVVEAIVKAATE